MKNIILFDTSIGSMNHGDQIIVKSFENNAGELLENNYVTKFPTHTPCFLPYQQVKRNKRYKFVSEAEHKFICGTNIINNHMLFPWPFWNINLFNSNCYKNAILVGVGVTGFKNESIKISTYSKCLLLKILSRDYIHSTRDEKTKKVLEEMGLKAINTGCPTIWGLTSTHCKKIPTKKANRVIFTFTDYERDPSNDKILVEVLKRHYSELFFWPQGIEDYLYFHSVIGENSGISVISPDLKSYSNLLSSDIDYVGTRLHAGIFAMQHCKRTVILSVDNRAKDMAQVYNLNIVDRKELSKIENMIMSDFETNVRIDEEKIRIWKEQFI